MLLYHFVLLVSTCHFCNLKPCQNAPRPPQHGLTKAGYSRGPFVLSTKIRPISRSRLGQDAVKARSRLANVCRIKSTLISIPSACPSLNRLCKSSCCVAPGTRQRIIHDNSESKCSAFWLGILQSFVQGSDGCRASRWQSSP